MRGWAKLLIGYEMSQKDRRRNIGGPKWKRKKEIKYGKDFWAA
jgi:hypothetical protein